MAEGFKTLLMPDQILDFTRTVISQNFMLKNDGALNNKPAGLVGGIMSKLVKKICVLAALPMMAAAGTAEADMSNLTNYEADVYAAAESYVNDPQWADGELDTSYSLKKKKCEEGNFFKMGFNRSFNSKKREKGLEKVHKKCKKVDVKVDEVAYFAGYDKGQLARCSFRYGFFFARGGKDTQWTICNSEELVNFRAGYEVGQTHAPVLKQYKQKEQQVIELEDRIVLLEFDMNNGTDTAEIGDGKKTDYLKMWNRDLNNARASVLQYEARNPEVFDTAQILEDNEHFRPKHWRDQP